MAMSGRKKITSHTHTDADVKQAAKYERERMPQSGTPASEIIMDADAESTRTLDAVNEDTISIAIVPETVPSENLLVNSGFERDVNADGVPDNWTLYQQIGTGSLILDTTDGVKGKQCLKVTADTTASTIWAMSELFTVNQLKRYFIEAWYKCERANNADVSILIYYYRADKTTLNEMDYVITHGNGLTTWQKFSKVSTATLTTSKYGRILLGVKTPTVAPAYILFDDIICSLQRATVSSAGTVAASDSLSGTPVAVPATTWTTIATINPTDVDMEEYFVDFYLVGNVQRIVHARILDNTDSICYPRTNGVDVPVLTSFSGAYYSSKIQLPIPKDVGGHVLYLQVLTDVPITFFVDTTHWGHSPHTHS